LQATTGCYAKGRQVMVIEDTFTREGLIAYVMVKFSWSREFAVEYVMERQYNGLSHGQAIAEALRKAGY